MGAYVLDPPFSATVRTADLSSAGSDGRSAQIVIPTIASPSRSGAGSPLSASYRACFGRLVVFLPAVFSALVCFPASWTFHNWRVPSGDDSWGAAATRGVGTNAHARTASARPTFRNLNSIVIVLPFYQIIVKPISEAVLF